MQLHPQTRCSNYSLHPYGLGRKDGIEGLVNQRIDNMFSQDHEVGDWHSSLASVGKLSDTLCIEDLPFRLPLVDVEASEIEKTIPGGILSSRRHDSLLKSLVVSLPQIVAPDVQQSAVE